MFTDGVGCSRALQGDAPSGVGCLGNVDIRVIRGVRTSDTKGSVFNDARHLRPSQASCLKTCHGLPLRGGLGNWVWFINKEISTPKGVLLAIDQGSISSYIDGLSERMGG